MMKPRALLTLGATDARLFFWFTAHSHKKTVALLSRAISRCGDGRLYAFIGIGVWYWESVAGAAFFYAGLLAYAIELPLYLLLKNAIRRHRPCHGITGVAALIEPSDKFSFPSGHTAAAFVFAAVLAAFYPLLALPAFVLATLIGLSRVMLGVHYPGDIVAGAVLGLLSAAAALQWLGV